MLNHDPSLIFPSDNQCITCVSSYLLFIACFLTSSAVAFLLYFTFLPYCTPLYSTSTIQLNWLQPTSISSVLRKWKFVVTASLFSWFKYPLHPLSFSSENVLLEFFLFSWSLLSVSVFLFVYLNHYPKECCVRFLWLLICLFLYRFIYYSFHQTHFRNLEWNWFVIRRVREHSDLKWQLDILKRKSTQTKKGRKKVE